MHMQVPVLIDMLNGAILVTWNVRDFQRIPNLTIENWAV
jgi:predicted nucleic acid-binding protein